MRSSRSGDRARSIAAAVLLVVIVGSSAMVVLPQQASTVQHYAAPADLVDGVSAEDSIDPRLVALPDRDERREARAMRVRGDHDLAFTAPGRVSTPTLVLVRRAEPYDLADVAAFAPAAFGHRDDGGLVLRQPLLVAPGAELVVDSATVPKLYLASGPSRYATISAVRSTLTFQGHEGRRLLVTTFDPSVDGRDQTTDDGRSYIVTRGGRMDADHTDFEDLGFPATGVASGVAWISFVGHPATGGADHTTFRRNHIGAYASAAQGLRFTHASFLDNTIYGFDPHTGTDHTVVEGSVAARNGRHGFIFSEGCVDNVVRDSEAFLNGGSGFVVDDGNPDHGLGRPSDDTRFLRVSSHDNGAAGVVVEGGRRNVVRDSAVTNNEFGIWVRNEAADTEIRNNTVVATRWTGIRLDEGLGPTQVDDNEVAGARNGIASGGSSPTTMTNNWIRGITGQPLQIEGDQSAVAVHDLLLSDAGRGITLSFVLHRAVMLSWIVILLLPLVSCLAAAGGRRARRPSAIA